MVIVLAMYPRFVGSNPAENDGFLMAIKLHSTTSFGGESKAVGPMSFYGTLKNLAEYNKKYLVGKNSWTFLASFLLLRYYMSLLTTARALWWMIRNDCKTDGNAQ
jgi:hypothetical protein